MVLFGVGCSLTIPATINFTLIFVIGLPVGTALAYGVSLGVHGLWIGLILAIFGIFVGHVIYIICTIDWDKAAELAVKKASSHEPRVDDLGQMPIGIGSTDFDIDEKDENAEYLAISTIATMEVSTKQ